MVCVESPPQEESDLDSLASACGENRIYDKSLGERSPSQVLWQPRL